MPLPRRVAHPGGPAPRVRRQQLLLRDPGFGRWPVRYAGNRLHDSIGIFAVGPDGTLRFVGEEWTRGDYPRSFNFDPTGRFLYSCNQRADNIAVFRVDRGTGGLDFTGFYAAVGNPSMTVFLEP